MSEDRLKKLLALDDDQFATEATKIVAEIQEYDAQNNIDCNEETTRDYLNKNSKLDLYTSFRDRVLAHNENIRSNNNLKTNPVVFAEDSEDPKDIEETQELYAKEVVKENEKNYNVKENKNNTEHKNFTKKFITGLVVAGIAIGAAFGIKSCVDANSAKKEQTTETDTDAEKEDNTEKATSSYAQNEQQTLETAAKFLNETRKYGNNTTAEEMRNYLLTINYENYKNDETFLEGLNYAPSDTYAEDSFNNFVGYRLDDGTFKGATNGYIYSFINAAKDSEDYDDLKQFSNDFTSLFQADDDSKAMSEFNNELILATTDSANEAQHVSNASKYLLDIYGNNTTLKTSAEAKAVMTYEYNTIVRGLHTGLTESDENTVNALRLCEDVADYKTISENAKVSSILVRDHIGALADKLRTIQEDKKAHKVEGILTYEDGVAVLRTDVTAEITDVNATAATNQTGQDYNVTYGDGNGNDIVSETVHTESSTTTSTSQSTSQTAEEQQNQETIASQNATTEAEASKAASGSITDQSGQVDLGNNVVSNTYDNNTVNYDGNSIKVTDANGNTSTAPVNSDTTAKQINSAIAQGIGETTEQVSKEVKNIVVNNEGKEVTEHQADSVGDDVVDTYDQTQAELDKAAADYQKAVEDLGDGFEKTDSSTSTQDVKDAQNVTVAETGHSMSK